MSRGLQICLALLRIATGLSLVASGAHKLGWFAHPGLEQVLATWTSHTTNPLLQKYLGLVTPHASVLARVVAVGELGLGALLILGLFTPLAALLGFIMVLNFHFASGKMFSLDYLTGMDGLVYLLIFLVLASGRAGLALGLDGALGKKSSAAAR